MSSVQPQSGSAGELPGASPPGPVPHRSPLALAQRGSGGGGRGASGSSGDSPYGPPPGDGPYGGGGAHDVPYGDAGSDPLAGMPPLAPLLRRLAARIVDALLIGIPVGIVLWATTTDRSYDVNDQMQANWQQLAYLLIYFLYEGAMLSATGQTVGKKLMRIRVAMLEHGQVPRGVPGWLRAAIYSIPVLVPCCGSLFWLVNVLWCTWDRPYRQCLHDKGAKTVVVEAR